ncbi:MAG: type 1 glutamine amidotransferase [Candidatus Brockarchaeota archaeon]|nr:type 1 glutamine amidotransferase [Candidatus Brockarchaeota archaeon]
MGKNVVIIVANEFEDIELLYPLLRLSEEGAKITVVPVKSGLHPRPSAEKPVSGRYGTPVPLEVMAPGKRYIIKTLEEIKTEEVDCLLFPGGFSPDALRTNKKVIELVKRANRLGKLIAAICHGPQVLISAGIVRGKRITAYKAVRDDLINAGAVFEDVPAVRDGNIITGRVPDDLPEFCREIISFFSKQ